MIDIEQIKSTINLRSLISESCKLDSSGRGAHENKHDSESGTCLYVDNDWWYCHHCHAGGDALDWIMDRDGVDFPEALRTAAGIAGIPLDGSDPAAESERRAVFDVLKAAAIHFHENLTDAHRADITARWGITNETIDKLLIGIARNDEALEIHLKRQGFTYEQMVKSGLFFDWNSGLKPSFQGRYVFPYWKGGTVRYMIARQTEHTPKNKWEKAKYKKLLTHDKKHPYVSEHVRNDTLYGVDSLRGVSDWCLVTEGVTDCIMALQAGIPCISPVTVRFKKADHKRILKLVKRLETVYLCNDNEDNEAGLKGAISTAEYLEANGITTRLIALPRAEGVEKIDLAEYLRDHGVEEFKALFDTAVSVWNVKLSSQPVGGGAVENVKAAKRFIAEELSAMDAAVRVAFIESDVRAHFGLSDDVIGELIKVTPEAAKPGATTPQHDNRLAFRTDHLNNYRSLDDLVALEGRDYTPLIKAVWYNIIGTLKAQPVRFGNITTDTRFNLFIPMPSGTGKNNLKQAIQRIVSMCGKEVRSPTSFHPEQLIGKMISEKWHNPEKEGKGLNDTRYIPNYGYLKKDSVIFDESYHFITREDKQYDESKAYIRIALDPIGSNLIQKKLVDQLDVPEQRLEYYPHCSITMFLQPKGMDDDNVLTGFLRRFNVIYIPLVGKNLDRREEIMKYLTHPRPEVSFDYWKDITEWDAPTYFDFEDGINDLLYALHNDLITYMRSLGDKQRNYTDRKVYALFDDLIGMAAIQAISRKSNVVTLQDVKLAYMDLFEFFRLSLDYVNAKVFGNLDYGEQWHGAEAKEIEALKWLAGSGATDKDTSEVTIAAFKAKIAEIFEIEEESARRHYSKLKKRGLIDSKRIGKDSSRVWITFDPDQVTDVVPMPLTDTLYWKIAQNGYHPAHLHTCTTLEHDNGFGDLQVCNAPTDSGSGKNTESIAGGAKSGAADLQVCNAPIEDGSGDLQVCNSEPIASGQVCNRVFDKTDSERTSGTSVQVCTGSSVKNPIELAQDDRMKAIDQFFRNHREKDGGPAEIRYVKDESELMKFVPDIANKLHISRDVAFKSVMQYGKDRGWV